MQEQWRRKGSREGKSESDAQEVASTRKLRENWEILEGNGTGITTYETPSGIYEAEVGPDGTLIRLKRIKDKEITFYLE